MASMYYKEKKIFCYVCRKNTFFTYRDLNNNVGVESHCDECLEVWFEWQNRAVQREMEKWIKYNATISSSRHLIKFLKRDLRNNLLQENLPRDIFY